jgi:hypothetical protein
LTRYTGVALGLADEKMNVLGHGDLSVDAEAGAAHALKGVLKTRRLASVVKGTAVITMEGYEMASDAES